MYAFIGMWVLRRAFRILTADDSRPLAVRVGAEGKRILVGAAITLALSDPQRDRARRTVRGVRDLTSRLGMKRG